MVTSESTAAETRRSASGRRRFWAALAVLALVAAFAASRSALFRLDKVQLTGAKHVTADLVMAETGLYPGAPRWEYPASVIRARLLREPWIKSATVSWHWNQLQVNVQERSAVGLLRYNDPYYMVLDDSGILLEQTDLESARGLPVISGVTLTKALRGQQLTHQGLLNALSVLSLMASPLRSQVSEVHVETDGTLTFYMAGGPTVLWGTVPLGQQRSDAIAAKLEDFGGAWQQVANKQSRSCQLDLRVDGKAIQSGCK